MNLNKGILLVFCFIVITLSAIAFFEIDGTAIINDKLLPELPFSKLTIILFSCLVFPIIEEFGFRYWILAKGWKRYLSLSIALSFILASANLVLIAAFIVVVGYNLLSKASLPIKVIFSSIFFSLLHLNIGFSLSFFSYFIFFTLMGVMFCLLYIKKGIWLPIVMHIVYNSLLMLVLSNGYFGFKDKTVEYNINETKCTLRFHGLFYANRSSHSIINQDSIVIEGFNKTKAVLSLLEKQDGYKYSIEPSLDKISLKIIGKSAIEKQQMIAMAFHLKFDTSESKKEDIYQIIYKPNPTQTEASAQSKENADYSYSGPINGFAKSLSNHYGLLFESQDTNFVYLNVEYQADFKQLKKEMESKFGLKFIATKKEIKTINVSFDD